MAGAEQNIYSQLCWACLCVALGDKLAELSTVDINCMACKPKISHIWISMKTQNQNQHYVLASTYMIHTENLVIIYRKSIWVFIYKHAGTMQPRFSELILHTREEV